LLLLPDGAHGVVYDLAKKTRTVLQDPLGIPNIFSPDGNFVAGHNSKCDKTLIWKSSTGEFLYTLEGHGTEQCYDRQFISTDSSRIITWSNQVANVWDLKTGHLDCKLGDGHTDRIFSASFSLDGAKIVTSSSDATARIWELKSGTCSQVLGHERGIVSTSFSPDGKLALTASLDATAAAWSVETGKELYQIPLLSSPGTDAICGARFSPQGDFFLTNGTIENSAFLFDVKDGKQVFAFRGHTKPVLYAAFSADGTWVVTCSVDETLRLWKRTKK
jgi:WD40 repeat protein